MSVTSRSTRIMELRMRKKWKDGETSPERTKVRTETYSNHKLKSDRKVPVVYYISRNGQLEHPHFMEVPLSSPNGLYLRDVINRFNSLHGKGMASMHSWSAERSYRNRFVWHDLEEHDIIYPTHGQEYVLKGSKLLENDAIPSQPRRRRTPRMVSEEQELEEDRTDERDSKEPDEVEQNQNRSTELLSRGQITLLCCYFFIFMFVYQYLSMLFDA
ncbi:PREDICTED: protein UPSTREAM OF FLC-like [Nicotiana attenuata]|uniref:Protein upstream of flc n=1 Tax=Nicotiana attenuata TaxID=49451 RepID=A0A1J6ISY6_NICAT|nr:PREDICTED: protein UPSTREAM OF FLC-like [Nicotiana attenuata]OIT00839.1 protein upstream of flc [Nicotiana attenuata]